MVVNSCESEVARASGNIKRMIHATASRLIFVFGNSGYPIGLLYRLVFGQLGLNLIDIGEDPTF